MGTQPSFDDLGQQLFDATFVVLDLETTGLSPATDRITEVGAVKVRRGDVLGELQTLVHPGRSVPAKVAAVTGITDHLLAGAPPVAAVLPTLLEFLGEAVLVAHNARFDVGFLDAELARLGHPRLSCTVLDTARLARRLVRDEVRDLRLATLARLARSRVAPEHRALVDARATVDVFHHLVERAGCLGAVTVEDLRDLQRASSERAFRKVALAADVPAAPGVYRFVDDADRVLYVGKAVDLRSRVRQYFGQDDRRKVDALVRETAAVRWDVTPTELEAQVREVREIVARRPRFNRRSTRPERAVWLRWTDERIPRLSVSRSPGDGAALGPLGSRRVAQAMVEAVQEVVPVRQCTFRIRVAQDHPPCVLKELGRCGAPCDGTQDPHAYADAIAPARALISGDPSRVLALLRARMLALAAEERFEDAARVRGRLHALAGAVQASRSTQRLVAVEHLVVARRVADGLEVVRIARGRLVSSAALPSGSSDAAAVAAVPPRLGLPDLPVPPEEHEEVRLVRRWLDRGGRVLEVDGEWSSVVAGGAVTAAAATEARAVARRTSRDAQELRRDKVRRRPAA